MGVIQAGSHTLRLGHAERIFIAHLTTPLSRYRDSTLTFGCIPPEDASDCSSGPPGLSTADQERAGVSDLRTVSGLHDLAEGMVPRRSAIGHGRLGDEHGRCEVLCPETGRPALSRGRDECGYRIPVVPIVSAPAPDKRGYKEQTDSLTETCLEIRSRRRPARWTG